MPKFYWVLRQNFDRNSDFRRRDRPWQGTNPRVPNTGHKIQPNFEFWSWTLDSMMKNSWFDWILWRGLMDLSLEWLGTPMGVPRRCCKSPSRTCQSPSRASQGPPPIYVWFALFTFAASWSLFLWILSLSLFMFWIGTNYYKSTSPTDQSTFFTNFTNRGRHFHILNSWN